MQIEHRMINENLFNISKLFTIVLVTVLPATLKALQNIQFRIPLLTPEKKTVGEN